MLRIRSPYRTLSRDRAGKEDGFLEQHGALTAHAAGHIICPDVFVLEEYASRRRLRKAGQRFQERGFAGAVGADHGEEFAWFDGQFVNAEGFKLAPRNAFGGRCGRRSRSGEGS